MCTANDSFSHPYHFPNTSETVVAARLQHPSTTSRFMAIQHFTTRSNITDCTSGLVSGKMFPSLFLSAFLGHGNRRIREVCNYYVSNTFGGMHRAALITNVSVPRFRFNRRPAGSLGSMRFRTALLRAKQLAAVPIPTNILVYAASSSV